MKKEEEAYHIYLSPNGDGMSSLNAIMNEVDHLCR